MQSPDENNDKELTLCHHLNSVVVTASVVNYLVSRSLSVVGDVIWTLPIPFTGSLALDYSLSQG
jgi:hypothetical protein